MKIHLLLANIVGMGVVTEELAMEIQQTRTGYRENKQNYENEKEITFAHFSGYTFFSCRHVEINDTIK